MAMPMVTQIRQRSSLLLILALTCATQAAECTTNKSVTINRTSQCEARTINHITHTLPQLCLKDTWSSFVTLPTWPTPTYIINQQTNAIEDVTIETNGSIPGSTGAHAALFPEAVVEDAVATPFMSFEDWKEMMLRRTGQDPQEMRLRQPSERRPKGRSPEPGDSGLGEEGEISLSFDNYQGNGENGEILDVVSTRTVEANKHPGQETALKDGGATIHQTKDAGKTCKERFSYSSFDAGATILKAGPDAKNAKAILVENKDSYMLLECAAQDKYVIVELSDDITIDTVVIANFEFFSSMIHHFRISVSDRYPVRIEKWRDLGIFEAKNSRDIQPFAVQHPQIWAKYVRIEFLTHYGNEYYCPVSLLRVHGSSMLDSWKDSETGQDEETSADQGDAMPSLPSSQQAAHSTQHLLRDTPKDLTDRLAVCSWLEPSNLGPFHDISGQCPASMEHPDDHLSGLLDLDTQQGPDMQELETSQSAKGVNRIPVDSHRSTRLSTPNIYDPSVSSSKAAFSSAIHSSEPRQPPPAESGGIVGAGLGIAVTNISSSHIKTTLHTAVNGKPRSSWTASASAASPTVQEGFFNAITKRLQQVESNLTLSLQYVEEQSRHLQEVLQKAEQNQVSKLSRFLADINQTVLNELRDVRDLYDQTWQSTVLAFESQRAQSERDFVALSARLNLLADEVVFQKRMAIIQAVLLLSCLFLVIFSRGVSIPYLTPLQDQAGSIPYTPASVLIRPEPHTSSHSNNSRGQGEVSLTGTSNGAEESLPNHRTHHTLTLLDSDHLSSQANGVEYRHCPHVAPSLNEASHFTGAQNPEHELQSVLIRRGPAINHNHNRKPLPSLPEHSVPTR